MNAYLSAHWHQFRAEVIRLDGGACVRCGKGPADGAVLQVHHKQYFAGREPWRYPHASCETLCRGCHAVEHGKIPPTSGWSLVGCDDLGDLIGECEYCRTALRYTYLIQHPKWHALEVGTDCCDHLTGTTQAEDHRKAQDSLRERRKTFVSSSRWKREGPSAEAIGLRTRQLLRVRVLVKRLGDEYAIFIEGSRGRSRFPSASDAKARVFDLNESGELDAWIDKRFPWLRQR